MNIYWETITKPEESLPGEARILRVFGETPAITLPDTVTLPGDTARYTVTELGAYCFAGQYQGSLCSDHIHVARPANQTVPETDSTGSSDTRYREIGGTLLHEIVLPAGVRKIGRFAFYNCRELKKMEIGTALSEVEADAFMNCTDFHTIRLRGGIREKSGIRTILAQISSDMEVIYGREHPEAVLLYPDYYESYDEIAPAHIFGRNIEGEGFRARQCFLDGVPDFKHYDTIFPKARAEENERTLVRLALNRLCYPVDLSDERKAAYEDYIREHARTVLLNAVKNRDAQIAVFLCQQGLTNREEVRTATEAAAAAGWGEGVVRLQKLEETYFPRLSIRERYQL